MQFTCGARAATSVCEWDRLSERLLGTACLMTWWRILESRSGPVWSGSRSFRLRYLSPKSPPPAPLLDHLPWVIFGLLQVACCCTIYLEHVPRTQVHSTTHGVDDRGEVSLASVEVCFAGVFCLIFRVFFFGCSTGCNCHACVTLCCSCCFGCCSAING